MEKAKKASSPLADRIESRRQGYHDGVNYALNRHIGYMDMVDFDHHLGSDSMGFQVFPSTFSLKAGTKHSLETCGIVEVEIRLRRVIAWPDVSHRQKAKPKAAKKRR